MKKFCIALLLAVCAGQLAAQNINVPNKIGPMGLQVNTYSGNLFFSRNDFVIPARGMNLDIGFFYNSFNYDQNVGYGNGWRFRYHIAYRNNPNGTKTIIWGDGREDEYTKQSNGSYKAPRGFFGTLSEYEAGRLMLREKDGVTFFFDNATHRRITKIEDPNGNGISFSYTDTLLTALTTTAGQRIQLAYSSGRLKTITDALAAPTRTYAYDYDAAGNLVAVTNPLGSKNRYAYLVNGPLKSVADKNNNVVNVVYYNDFSVSEMVGCNKRMSFSYDSSTLTSYVTDHLAAGSNQVTKYEYQRFENLVWLVKQSGNCCGFQVSFQYDQNGNIVKMTNANGHSYSISYDDRGNRLTITDPLNQQISYTYSTDFSRVLISTDPNGHTSKMTYDAKGNLTKIEEPGGGTTTLTYSTNGDMIKAVDAKGNVESFAYDAFGQLTTHDGPLGFQTKYVHDARGNLLTLTDPRGARYQFEYDASNRVKKVTNPLNGVMQFDFDPENNLLAVTNAKGQVRKYSYDAANRLVSVANTLGHRRWFTYDEMDNLVQVKNALGHTMEMKYDNRNRLHSVTDPQGNTVQYSYDPNGNLLTTSYPTGRIIRYTYDVLDRVIKSEDHLGMMNSFSYDKNGNVISVRSANGATSTYSYDALDRLAKEVDALGNEKTFQYDIASNLLSVTDRNGRKTAYTYDALHRPIRYTDPNGFTTSMAYDQAGNLTSLADPKNNVTTYTYDALNRLTRTTYPDGKFKEFNLDILGNVLAKKLTDGSSIQYQYDSLNRLVSKQLPDGNLFTYGYDALNRLLSATNKTASVALTFDALNRLTSESLNGETTRYTYDDLSLIRNTIYPDSTMVTKTYDSRYRLLSVARGNTILSSYQYNSSNQLTGIAYGNKLTSQLQYDFANRLSAWATGSGTIQNYQLAYDKERNITGLLRNNAPALSEEYGFDAGYRLTSFKQGPAGSPAVQHSYQYDQAGNRTAATLAGATTNYVANQLNQLSSAAGSQNIAFTYDQNGNLTFDGVSHKKYDAENRLLSDSVSPSQKTVYQYDAFGRLVQKITSGNAVVYTYSGITPIAAKNAGSGDPVSKTIYAGFLRPVALEKDNQLFYYHSNHLGSVEAISNAGGGLVEQYNYDPYGNMRISDAAGNPLGTSQVGNTIGFTGQRFDERGNLGFHYRQYSPKTGRFNQRDPMGYYDGMNLYAYGQNDPVNNTDALGLWISDESLAAHTGGGNIDGGGPSLGDLYQGAKNVKDALSALSGLDRYNLLKEMADPVTQRFQDAFPWKDWAKENLAENSRLNQFLNNPWTQRLVIGLKFITLPEKFYKIWKEWDCGKLKTIVNTAEAGLSTTSLLYSLGKYNKWKWFRSSPNWLVWYSVLDVGSKATTGRSVLTNIMDLPQNVYDIEKGLWYMSGMEDRFGSLDNIMTGGGGNWDTPMPNFYEGVPERYVMSTRFR